MKEKQKTIISASRRTDMPKFYYEWLQEVLKAGEAELKNPRYPSKRYIVDLRQENVHSIVLWSKDFSNVLNYPMLLSNYNLYFQYTINNYSRNMEPHVPEYHQSIRILDGLLKRYTPQQFNIRFDPVVISKNGEMESVTDNPGAARLKAFEGLCKDLKALGMENCKVTTSYVCVYAHIKKRIAASGIDIVNISEENMLLHFEKMVDIAHKYDLKLYSCAAPLLEGVKGMKKGHCIDGELLQHLFGGKISISKDSGQREACGCTRSKDIGAYRPCAHGCVYCYQ